MIVAHADLILFGLYTLEGNQIIPDSHLASDGSYRLRSESEASAVTLLLTLSSSHLMRREEASRRRKKTRGSNAREAGNQDIKVDGISVL